MLLRAAKARALLARPRPRAARRRPGARRRRALAPPHARPRGRGRAARRDRRRRDRVDAGALGSPACARPLGCAALGLPAAARRRHVRRRAALRHRRRAAAARRGRGAVDRRRRAGRERAARARHAQRHRGAAAAACASRRRPAGCRCRPAGSTSRCCPSRCASPPAAAARACASRSRSAAAAGAAAAARARPARPVRARPARGRRRRARRDARAPAASSRSHVTAGGGDASPRTRAASLLAAAETEIDGLRPWREGSPASRIHWQSFARGAGLMERKLISEADSRPLVVLDPRAPASPDALDAAVRAAASLAVHFAQARRLRAAAARRPPRAHRSSTTCSPGRRRTSGSRCVDEHTGPSLAAAQNRRGLIVYVAARTGRPRPARARPHARRLPARGPGRAAEPPRGARGRRLPRLRRRAHRQRGADGGGRGARHERRGHVSALRGTGPRCAAPSPTPAAARRTRCARRARCCRSRSRAASRSSRSPRAARCTGCRCSSRPRPAARWHALGVGAARDGGPAAAPARLTGAARVAARSRSSPLAIALALLAGGVADELLRPTSWDELAAGIARGISDLPGVRVPYRGLDEWVAARDPARRHGARRARRAARVLAAAQRPRLPARRARAARALYAVPVVALDFAGEFLRGALFALLVVAFLRLEQLRLTEAGAAALLALGVAVAALIAAPALNRDAPWCDYETWALDDRLVEVDHVHLGPQLRPAELAARRPRAAARQGQAARLLEGREPRRLRRRALAAVASPARARRSTSSSRPTRPIRRAL